MRGRTRYLSRRVAVIVSVPLATVFALDVFVRHMSVLDGCMIVLVGVGRR